MSSPSTRRGILQVLPLRFPSSVLNRRRLRSLATLSGNWTVDPQTGCVSSSQNSSPSKKCFQVIVGLEIHVLLDIPTKLFSPALSPSSSIKSAMNTRATTHAANDSRRVHPFDTAVPGTLPRLSAAAVRQAVLVGAALQCSFPSTSYFERKHYTYADLPAGYQITQQRAPLAVDGCLEIEQNNDDMIHCHVERIQLEQDTAKTTTTSSAGTTVARVDFNRAGGALVEIVLAPTLRSSTQAASVVQAIRQLVRVTGTSRARMEEGELRVDCNVNVAQNRSSDSDNCPPYKSPRVEVKNLNSIQQVHDAVNFEAVRAVEEYCAQLENPQDSNLPGEETRTWDVRTKRTILMRRKDGREDYRFLPEPDLPPLVLEKALGQPVDTFLRENLLELPAVTRQRLENDPYFLTSDQASILANDPAAVTIFKEAVELVTLEKDEKKTKVSKRVDTKAIARITANFICNETVALVKEFSQTEASEGADYDEVISLTNGPLTGRSLADIVSMLLVEQVISTAMAKKLLRLLFTEEGGLAPRQLAEVHCFRLITDTEELRHLCRSVIEAHPEELAVYFRGGKFERNIKKLFVGKAMGASKRNAHPERLQDALEDVLDEIDPTSVS